MTWEEVEEELKEISRAWLLINKPGVHLTVGEERLAIHNPEDCPWGERGAGEPRAVRLEVAGSKTGRYRWGRHL